MDQSFQLRPAERSNFILYAVSAGSLIGALLGWLLPNIVWRTGGTTPLGDFALVCLLCISVWMLTTARVREGVIPTLALIWLGIFFFREIAWRFWPLVLAMIYGAAVTVLISVTLGFFVYESRVRARSGRGLSGGSILTPERLVSIVLGFIFLVWLIAASIIGWITT